MLAPLHCAEAEMESFRSQRLVEAETLGAMALLQSVADHTLTVHAHGAQAPNPKPPNGLVSSLFGRVPRGLSAAATKPQRRQCKPQCSISIAVKVRLQHSVNEEPLKNLSEQ